MPTCRSLRCTISHSYVIGGTLLDAGLGQRSVAQWAASRGASIGAASVRLSGLSSAPLMLRMRRVPAAAIPRALHATHGVSEISGLRHIDRSLSDIERPVPLMKPDCDRLIDGSDSPLRGYDVLDAAMQVRLIPQEVTFTGPSTNRCSRPVAIIRCSWRPKRRARATRH
jgi:hypothetical protein